VIFLSTRRHAENRRFFSVEKGYTSSAFRPPPTCYPGRATEAGDCIMQIVGAASPVAPKCGEVADLPS
jgi:hypothetical protein